jgi:hypothetical protein
VNKPTPATPTQRRERVVTGLKSFIHHTGHPVLIGGEIVELVVDTCLACHVLHRTEPLEYSLYGLTVALFALRTLLVRLNKTDSSQATK